MGRQRTRPEHSPARPHRVVEEALTHGPKVAAMEGVGRAVQAEMGRLLVAAEG